MEERTRLAVLATEGTYTVTELAKQFGVSRKTAYKWIDRYRGGGLPGMANRSRAPLSVPGRTPEEIERLVVKERERHPTWGGKKIQTILFTRHGIAQPPCIRTVLRFSHARESSSATPKISTCLTDFLLPFMLQSPHTPTHGTPRPPDRPLPSQPPTGTAC